MKKIPFKEFPFNGADETLGYKIFPTELENDNEVYFRGVDENEIDSLVYDGFKIKDPLPSVSFAATSELALKYACDKRDDGKKDAYVLAVRFKADNKSKKVKENSILHVYMFDPQPEILGFCTIPAEYKYR